MIQFARLGLVGQTTVLDVTSYQAKHHKMHTGKLKSTNLARSKIEF